MAEWCVCGGGGVCTVPLLNHIFQLDSFLLVSSLESPVKNLKKLLVDLIKVFN